MDFYEFLDAVLTRFPPKTSSIKDFDECYSNYRAALESSIDYDYQAAYDDLEANYPYSTAPYIETLKQYLRRHIKHSAVNDGLAFIREIKKTPRFNLYKQPIEFQKRIHEKLKKIGINSKIKELQ